MKIENENEKFEELMAKPCYDALEWVAVEYVEYTIQNGVHQCQLRVGRFCQITERSRGQLCPKKAHKFQTLSSLVICVVPPLPPSPRERPHQTWYKSKWELALDLVDEVWP